MKQIREQQGLGNNRSGGGQGSQPKRASRVNRYDEIHIVLKTNSNVAHSNLIIQIYCTKLQVVWETK